MDFVIAAVILLIVTAALIVGAACGGWGLLSWLFGGRRKALPVTRSTPSMRACSSCHLVLPADVPQCPRCAPIRAVSDDQELAIAERRVRFLLAAQRLRLETAAEVLSAIELQRQDLIAS